MAKWDYDKMYGNGRTQLSGAVAAKLRSEENQTIGQLFKFIEEWFHNYRLVCEEFDLYHNVPVRGYIPIGNYEYNIESYIDCLHNADFFSVSFFEKILQKTCIFEKIVSPADKFNYDYSQAFYGQNKYLTLSEPPSKLAITSEHFTLSRESSDTNRVWTLDTRMANNQSPQQGLALSLIATLMNNHVSLSLYKRNKHFRNFIDKFSEVTQFDFRFEGPDKLLVTSEVEVRSNPDCTTLKYKEGSKECVRIDHCRFGSNNLMFSYKHLDELYGKNRKEMLTEEDLQLYRICNEGRKPFIYDWEFTV